MEPPSTFAQAEAQGWDGVFVQCGCATYQMHWLYIKNNLVVGTFAAFIRDWRCDKPKCRQPLQRLEVYRDVASPMGQPRPVTCLIWPPAPPAPTAPD
jgi:hypothetical protein